jgi:nitric oxide reductase subunit B
MILMSLFPSGVMQLWDVVEHGYWHARSADYMAMPRSHLVEWLRLPGDLIFIGFGAIPLVIASLKGWLGVRADARAEAR